MDEHISQLGTYDAVLSYKENSPITFPDFTLTYLGNHPVVTAKGLTVSLQTSDFSIETSDGAVQVEKIGNGQMPNLPRAFSVGDKYFTLWSGIGPDGVSRLALGELVVTAEPAQ